ncbi:hypothetical protein UMZ34_00125 [Halopseudomonas pachastrellae]|nr:hypothetical protein UMZ34_00125 [Halopseudomonas pachastrellae]
MCIDDENAFVDGVKGRDLGGAFGEDAGAVATQEAESDAFRVTAAGGSTTASSLSLSLLQPANAASMAVVVAASTHLFIFYCPC